MEPCRETHDAPGSVMGRSWSDCSDESSDEEEVFGSPFDPFTPEVPPTIFQVPFTPDLKYPDLSSSLHSRPPLPNTTEADSEILFRVQHPYNVEAFESKLKQHGLEEKYPHLVNNLHHGFPLSRYLPEITESVIIPDNISAHLHPDAVQEYLDVELGAGRMSGPYYTKEETERILRGPFISSPLIVSVQPQPPPAPDKKRICRHLGKADKSSGLGSVNSYIDKEDFLTHFDMASDVADVVSFHFLLPHFSLSAWLVFHSVFRTNECLALSNLLYVRSCRLFYIRTHV
jgi:hypothetical protein